MASLHATVHMSKGPIRWPVRLIAAMLTVVATGAGAADREARQWLERMSEALATRNYEGRFFHLRDERSEAMRIYHRVDGKGTCKKRQRIPCPACQQTDCIDYIGSDVEEGSLEFVHLVHTEVRDWFTCERCGHSFSEYQHI